MEEMEKFRIEIDGILRVTFVHFIRDTSLRPADSASHPYRGEVSKLSFLNIFLMRLNL